MPTVRINVTVPLPWNQILGPGFPPGKGTLNYTRGDLSLPEPSPVGPHGRPFVELEGAAGRQSVRVRGVVDLKFCFPDAAAGYPQYAGCRPVGISFCKENDAVRSFETDLPRDTVRFGDDDPSVPGGFNVPYVSVKDKWDKKGADGKFKYMIAIQDCYGNVGIIDPDIENDLNPA